MSKKELQEALIERGELAEKIYEMTVGELRELWAEVENDPVLEVDVVVPRNEVAEVVKLEVCPARIDPEWQSYIMKQFADGELYKDRNTGVMRPTVHGLRRLVEKHVGPILESEARMMQLPTVENKYFATASWTIVVYDSLLGQTRRVTDVADHHEYISEGIFRLYGSTNAATKAEGRALRKLLNINVACSEEVANIDEEKIEEIFSKPSSTIAPSQVAAIKQLCKRAGMTVDEFMNGDPIDILDYSEALDAIEHLNKLINKKEKGK